jgi:hypothetical protein
MANWKYSHDKKDLLDINSVDRYTIHRENDQVSYVNAYGGGQATCMFKGTVAECEKYIDKIASSDKVKVADVDDDIPGVMR